MSQKLSEVRLTGQRVGATIPAPCKYPPIRTDLDHLPPQKQRELERVVQLIFEEFDDAFAIARHEWEKAGQSLKVIPYGRYARGTCVDELDT